MLDVVLCNAMHRAQYCYGNSSVRDVEVSRSHGLELFDNNFTVKMSKRQNVEVQF